MLHQLLWRINEDLASACLEHRFVRELAAGTLEPEVFKRYVAQDAFYLEAFFRVYALAAARCEGRHEAAAVFHRLMGGALDELQMHRRNAARLDIDLESVEPHPSTTAYVEFLVGTAWSMDLGTTTAAMTPCMRLYAEIGRSVVDHMTEEHPYREWIEAYSSDEFFEMVSEQERLLDELAEDGPELRRAYRRAIQFELGFFDAVVEDG